ncbi:hypothetical protein [Ralstonia thomasii]
MLPVDIRKTPRTLAEAFGPGARLFMEPRRIAFMRALKRVALAVAPFAGAVAVGAILYASFVVGVTGL